MAASTNSSAGNIHINVVILGAGYSGIGVAHQLLKYTKPVLKRLRVILVSPSTHHFWNLAAVRGIIPGEFDDKDLFRSIEPGFRQYGEDAFEFIVGSATSIDLNRNVVHVNVEPAHENASSLQKIPRAVEYAHLVIATGASYPRDHLTLPFTNVGNHRQMLESFHSMQNRVKKANTIIVGGSGPTGVETAGELGQAWGCVKTILLVVEGDQPLPGLLPQVRKTAASDLESLGVRIIRNTRVRGSTMGPSGKTAITLSSGEIMDADLFLPLYGMRPNTTFVPPHLLDARGSIKLDKEMCVPDHENLWAVGDAGNLEDKQLISAERQAIHLYGNLHHALLGKSRGSMKELKQAYGPQIYVTIGKKKGTGQFASWRVPGLLVTSTKAKTFFHNKGDGLVRGDNICRSSI